MDSKEMAICKGGKMRQLHKKILFFIFFVFVIGAGVLIVSKGICSSSDDNTAQKTKYISSEKRNKKYNYPDYAKLAGVPEKYFYTSGVYHSNGDEGNENGGYYIETIQTNSDSATDYYTNNYIFWEYAICEPDSDGVYGAGLTVVEASGGDIKIGAKKNKSGAYQPIVSIDLTNHGSKEVNPEVIKTASISETENNKSKRYNDEDVVGNIMSWPIVNLDVDLDTILELTPIYRNITWGEAGGDSFLSNGTDYENYTVIKKIGAGVNRKGYKKGSKIEIEALTSYAKNGTPKVIYKKGEEERCASVDYEFDILNSSNEVVLNVYNSFERRYTRE